MTRIIESMPNTAKSLGSGIDITTKKSKSNCNKLSSHGLGEEKIAPNQQIYKIKYINQRIPNSLIE